MSPPNSSPPGTSDCDPHQGRVDREWPQAGRVGCRRGGVQTAWGADGVRPTCDSTSLLCEPWADGGQATRAEQGAEGHAEPLIAKSRLGAPGGPAMDLRPWQKRFALLTFFSLPDWRRRRPEAVGRSAYLSVLPLLWLFVPGSWAVSTSCTHRSRKIRIVS